MYSHFTIFFQIAPDNAPHIALVVSPLKSLMTDQLRRCQDMGISAVMLKPAAEMTEAERQRKCQEL